MSPLVVASIFPWIAVMHSSTSSSFVDAPEGNAAARVMAAYPELTRARIIFDAQAPIASHGYLSRLDRIPGNEPIEIYARVGGTHAVSFFREELKRGVNLSREQALRGLSVAMGSALTSDLIKMLRDKNDRQSAITALSVAGDPAAIPYLIEALDKPSAGFGSEYQPPISEIACAGLVRFGSRALPALHRALESKNSFRRSWAIQALLRIQDSRSAKPLRKSFESDPGYRHRDAITDLASVGDYAAMTKMLSILDSRPPTYREVALLEKRQDDPRALKVLRRWAPELSQAAVIYARLGHAELRTEWEAKVVVPGEEDFAEALGAVGDARSIPALTVALASPLQYHSPIQALVRIGKPAIPAMIAILCDSPDSRMRAKASIALGLIGDPSTLPHLTSFAQRHPTDARKAVLDLILLDLARKVRVP